MKPSAFIVVIGAVLAIGAAHAQPNAPLKWTLQGNPRTSIDGVFPERAVRQNVDGRVAADCELRADWSMGPCLLSSEEPKGYGFINATQRALERLRVAPDQGLALGDVVSLTIVFETDGANYKVLPTLSKSARKGPLTPPTP